MKNLLFVLTLSLVFIGYGCLETDRVELEKRVLIEYRFDGLNTTFRSNTDTLNIESARMFVPRFWVITTSDDSLNSNVPFVFSFAENDIGEPKQIINANVGFSGLEDYDEFRMLVEQFTAESGLTDNTLNNSGDPLSFSIRGRFNGERFQFRSKAESDQIITYDEINLTDREETMILTIIGEGADWFADPGQSGELLDPTDEANRSVIEDQFLNSFRIESERISALDEAR